MIAPRKYKNFQFSSQIPDFIEVIINQTKDPRNMVEFHKITSPRISNIKCLSSRVEIMKYIVEIAHIAPKVKRFQSRILVA